MDITQTVSGRRAIRRETFARSPCYLYCTAKSLVGSSFSKPLDWKFFGEADGRNSCEETKISIYAKQ